MTSLGTATLSPIGIATAVTIGSVTVEATGGPSDARSGLDVFVRAIFFAELGCSR